MIPSQKYIATVCSCSTYDSINFSKEDTGTVWGRMKHANNKTQFTY